jgi:hypothetical protein
LIWVVVEWVVVEKIRESEVVMLFLIEKGRVAIDLETRFKLPRLTARS